MKKPLTEQDIVFHVSCKQKTKPATYIELTFFPTTQVVNNFYVSARLPGCNFDLATRAELLNSTISQYEFFDSPEYKNLCIIALNNLNTAIQNDE